jgi:hypothetical protein
LRNYSINREKANAPETGNIGAVDLVLWKSHCELAALQIDKDMRIRKKRNF